MSRELGKNLFLRRDLHSRATGHPASPPA
jgi:hypothetical protein